MLIPNRTIAVDPGDKYCGVTLWEKTVCYEGKEWDPSELTWWFYQNGNQFDCLVVERFVLYAWNEKSLAGNEFKTSQLIGCLKFIARLHQLELVAQFASQGKSTYKRAPFKHWRAADWRKACAGEPIGRGHVRDSAAHMYEFLRGRGFVPKTA